MESRKSARLLNTDTDFSRLADFNIVEQVISSTHLICIWISIWNESVAQTQVSHNHCSSSSERKLLENLSEKILPSLLFFPEKTSQKTHQRKSYQHSCSSQRKLLKEVPSRRRLHSMSDFHDRSCQTIVCRSTIAMWLMVMSPMQFRKRQKSDVDKSEKRRQRSERGKSSNIEVRKLSKLDPC